MGMKIAICDDEFHYLQEYFEKFTSIFEANEISAQIMLFNNCTELMFALEDEKKEIDIVFLDINMPCMNGMEMARWIREKQYLCEIIFLTISPNHMLSAFDVGALHYIVKGVTTPEKLADICLMAASVVDKRKSEVITASCAGETRVIPIKDIFFFEVRNYIIVVHYSGNEFEFYSTLGKIENALMGHGFLRVHRSFLVNTRHIRSIVRQELALFNGAVVPIGRKYLEDIRRVMHSRSV